MRNRFLRRMLLTFAPLLSLSPPSPLHGGMTIPEIRASYEQELFELAYTVYLANRNLDGALAVALRAVEARPNDRGWRGKAAQAAEWSGRADIALTQWFQLAQRGDQDAEHEALRLSRALNEFPLRMQLLEQMAARGGITPALLREYLTVSEGAGLPEKGYRLLISAEGVDPTYSLTEQARLAENLGLPCEAINAWERRARLKPLAPEEGLRLASLWYGKGDTERAFKSLIPVATNAGEGVVQFWRTFCDLAWALGKERRFTQGAELLIRSGNGLEQDYLRMVELYSEEEPGKGFDYALKGWQRFRKLPFWYSMVDNGIRGGKLQQLLDILKQMSPEERKVLSTDPRAWMAIARIYHQAEQIPQALTAASVAARMASQDQEILVSWLWLLVDLKRTGELKQLVGKLEQRIGSMPELREPLAAAMQLLGDTDRALRHYQMLLPANRQNPAWLVSFADILEQAGKGELAFRTRTAAARLLKRQPATGDDRLEKIRLQNLKGQLLMQLNPGDPLYAWMIKVAGEKQDRFARELVMGWSMARGSTDLARLWYTRRLAGVISGADWARLGLALEENDRTLMADLLEIKLDQLPYRDLVEAAQRSGMIPLAEQHAFDRHEINRDDHLVYSQLRYLITERTSFLEAESRLQDQSGVTLIENGLTVSQPLKGKYSLAASFKGRQFAGNRGGGVRNLPAADQRGELRMTRRHEGGRLIATLGAVSGGFNSLPTASLSASWTPWHDLQLELGGQLNGRGEESLPLSVGGVRDRLRLAGTGILTGKDSISLELAANRYHDQNRSYLGEGYGLELDLRHQFTRGWPDYGVRLFGGYSHYRSGRLAEGGIRRLIPEGGSQTASFFIPHSFGHFGGGIFLGQSWRYNYTRSWRPFASADIDFNSNSGAGFSYSLGLVGPLLGLDQLLLELTQGSGQFGVNDLSTTFGVNYRYLF